MVWQKQANLQFNLASVNNTISIFCFYTCDSSLPKPRKQASREQKMLLTYQPLKGHFLSGQNTYISLEDRLMTSAYPQQHMKHATAELLFKSEIHKGPFKRRRDLFAYHLTFYSLSVFTISYTSVSREPFLL